MRIGAARRALPRNVRALAWVSFATDLSSELLYPVLPLFLTVTLGAPVAVLGVIEGIAEGVAVGLRGASGRMSDLLGGRRLPWVRAGYALSVLARPLVAVAQHWGLVLVGRLVDRSGKAVRTAPRDALIRDSTPAELYGASFGYHRAVDSAGAVAGALAAALLLAGGASLRTVVWLSVPPGAAALLLLGRVREAPTHPTAEDPADAPERLPRRFWAILAVWTVFCLGNSSDTLLILRAKDLGLGITLAVLAYALYNVVYAGLSWPLGALSDLVARPAVLGAGLAVFALVYLGFAVAAVSWAVWPLFAVYGAYVAATEGVAKAWVGDVAPPRAGGTAFGIFSAATGGAVLVASVVAGALWSTVGPSAPFYLGAACAALALALLLLLKPARVR